LPRSTSDRPGGNIWDVKAIYATFKDGPDSQRDSNGEIGTIMSNIADYFARQREGFQLRLDQFNSVVDVQHLALPVTAAEFQAMFRDKDDLVGEFFRTQFALAGIPFNWSVRDGRYGTERRMYVIFLEGPRGTKFSSQGATAYECGRVSELEAGARITAINLRKNDMTPCDKLLRFENSKRSDWWPIAWDAVRFIAHSLAELPECHEVTANEIASDVQNRLENTLPSTDVRSNRWRTPTGRSDEPVMDAAGTTYFRIRTGPYVGDRCRDISYSPFWRKDPRWHAPAIREPATGTRSVVDRPDDSSEPQVKLYYLVPRGSVDREVDIRLDAMARSVNVWLSNQTDKTFRWDTSSGVLDVMFVQLEQTEEQLWTPMANQPSCWQSICPSPDLLLSILRQKGLVADNKLAAILYEGSLSPQNPNVSGCYAASSHVVLYQMCINDPFQTSPRSQAAAGSLGLRLLHELFHTLGAVPAGAPNGDGQSGHIRGDSNDIMAIGSRTSWEVDPGRDDYWGHGVAGREDVSQSIFLNPKSASAAFPLRWSRSRT
jgi:hypothetical protein